MSAGSTHPVAEADRAAMGSRWREAGFRWVALLLAVFWGIFFYGGTDLIAFLMGPEFHEALLLSTGWGVLFLFLVAAPLVIAALRPRRPGALIAGGQVALVAVAVGIGAVWSASPSHLLVAGGLLLTTLLVVVTRPARRRSVSVSWPWLPWALVVGAAVPWLGYAAASAASARADQPPRDITASLNHWPVQAGLAIAIVLLSALAATVSPGSKTPAWTVGISAAWLAVVAWIYPDLAGSMSRPWASAALAWAVGFVMAVHLATARKSPR
jgi:hypothetical protein